MSDEIASVAEMFGIGRNKLIVGSVYNFVEGEVSKCEKRIGKLRIENDVLNTKYGTSLKDLFKALDELECEEEYEEKEIKGFSVLEAVSDTRRWGHIMEDLKVEEARCMGLMESKKRMGTDRIW